MESGGVDGRGPGWQPLSAAARRTGLLPRCLPARAARPGRHAAIAVVVPAQRSRRAAALPRSLQTAIYSAAQVPRSFQCDAATRNTGAASLFSLFGWVLIIRKLAWCLDHPVQLQISNESFKIT